MQSCSLRVQHQNPLPPPGGWCHLSWSGLTPSGLTRGKSWRWTLTITRFPNSSRCSCECGFGIDASPCASSTGCCCPTTQSPPTSRRENSNFSLTASLAMCAAIRFSSGASASFFAASFRFPSAAASSFARSAGRTPAFFAFAASLAAAERSCVASASIRAALVS